MNADEALARRRESARWFAIAAEDARVARACLQISPPSPEIAAYLCQQAAEKVVKGLLMMAGVEFARTHDLDRLASAAEPAYPDLRAPFEAIRSLTPWGTAYRYPGPEQVPEPLPRDDEIEQVLGVVDVLAARLGTLIGE